MEICQAQPSLTPLASAADASRFAAITRCRAASLSGCCCAEAHLEKGSGEAGASERRGNAASAAAHPNQTGAGVSSAL